jgi:dTDP-4-dehydrorhamnose 3,5-epimerase
MKVLSTDIKDVVIVEPKVFEDNRGFFYESYNELKYIPQIKSEKFVQDNFSYSQYGTLRGLHYQTGEYSQAKLVSCIQGKVLDIIVDIRNDSDTYGQSISVELSSENKRQLYVPRGFAHGFVVLSETALFHYKCDNFYSPENESGIYYADESLALDWILPNKDLVISDKDRKLPLFKDMS